jgi:hypothetical protein
LIIIKKWWKSLDPDNKKHISTKQFLNLVMEKKIVKTEFEAVRMIKNYLGYNFDMNSNIYLS